MSSDDEVTDVELSAFRLQMQQLCADRRLVMADVTEDFASVREVGRRFERWRAEDWTAYKEAYVSLCIPKVVGPIIRLKLACWSPLDEGEDVERADWFDALAQYGLGGSEEEAQLRVDPDLLLVPRVVDRTLLPKITQVIEAQWDPVSTSQTLRLVGLVRRLVAEFPSLTPTSKPLGQLFKLVVEKLRAAVDHDVFIPIYPKTPGSGASAVFFERQFGCGVKLLRNLLAWHGLLGDAALHDVALVALLNRYLLTGLRSCQPADAAAKTSLIASTFPRAWFNQASAVAPLAAFVAQVRHIASQLDRSAAGGRELAERTELIADSLQPGGN